MTNDYIMINDEKCDYASVVNLMDEEICESLHNSIDNDVTNQEFYNMYCDAHFAKYGSEFTYN